MADNISVKDGTGASITMKTKEVSAGIQASQIILVNSAGGEPVSNPSSSFTRPADTTAYASGDLVANSTTAGSVTPLSFTASASSAGSFMIRRIRLSKSNTSTTNASFRVHFGTASPTFTNGDNGALVPSGVATYLGCFDLTMDTAFSDGASGRAIPLIGSEISVKLASGQTLYAWIEARAAYTPASGETFTLVLEEWQN